MSLQPGWDKTEQVNAVTSIFGYNENLDSTDSAVPWALDDWFHGDFRTDRPGTLSEALSNKNPDLDEYSDPFPAWRINSVMEIGFNTPDGETIPDGEWEITMEESEQAPVTLEAYPNSPQGNPFRNEFDSYDDHNPGQYLESVEKGPHVAKQKLNESIQGVEGVRGSIIYGGSDGYLVKAKNLADIAALLSGVVHFTPLALAPFFTHITTFYTFVDFVFMADGTKLVRLWDASRYPAHALYVSGSKRDQNAFAEGVQWTTDANLGNTAFEAFAIEGSTPGLTPFDQLGSFGYRNGFRGGSGPHPVGDGRADGSILTVDEVLAALPDPLFPTSIDNPI